MPKRARRFYPKNDATEPLVTVTSPQGGRPTDIDLRAIVNALRSKHRIARQWRLLPADVPPMSAVRSSFDPWIRIYPRS